MARSERLASIAPMLWAHRVGRRAHLPEWIESCAPGELTSALMERIIEQLDDFAARWHPLPVAGGVTLLWDEALRSSAS